ncbi:hypothetical protein KY084_09510 [Stakelama sp. CBK3Z-3]|uniref:PAS domain-containing protein n=1 Tax=Stakelama flava TaxID=2860338 RepID=A0ABS6XMV3_9SPHN|nr:hypothetical protein [Stakelama flava]MBW4331108.1 hypothetical protein [Stakelama flava]
MDTARGIDGRKDYGNDATDGALSDTPLNVGSDERRMHVRAYNHWVSLLHGRPYPMIGDLDPGSIADFGSNSVLLDFTAGLENPAIRFLGDRLRGECGVDSSITHVDQVPSRSLLSRLTDHYLQIIANRAPIGFEAEFVGQRGHNTLYRGILMPFSSTAESIDFIYGVINWKELVDAETQAKLDEELEKARSTPRPKPLAAPVWADGPGSGSASADLPVAPRHEPEVPRQMPANAALGDHLMLARETAASVRAADTRSRSALYRALARAYDFACAAQQDGEGYARLIAEAGLKVQKRAPMTPVVKLVFGADYDKARVTEFAAALDHAKRHGVAPGGFGAFIDAAEGGLKGLVKAERAARRPAGPADRYEQAAGQLRTRAAIASVPMGAGDAEFVVLVARRGEAGMLDVVAKLDDDAALTRRAVSRSID